MGVVEKAKIIDGSKVSVGDKIIGLPSSGPHSNGYSLIRKVLETTGLVPDETLLDELLAPTRIYVKQVRKTLESVDVHGMVHITGGGFYENIPRIFTTDDVAALIDIDSWQRPQRIRVVTAGRQYFRARNAHHLQLRHWHAVNRPL